MGQQAKSNWATVGMIALAIVAAIIPGGQGLSGLLLAGLKAVIVIGGGMLISRELAASQPRMPEGSQVYSWNPQTVQQPGGSLPKSYGRNRAHGNIIAVYTSEVNSFHDGEYLSRSEQQLNMLIDYGEGPVEGLVADSVLINGQPASYWSGVTLEFKRGLVDQTACTAFADRLPIEIPIGIPVTHTDGPQTYRTPDAHFDDLEIVIAFPEGIFRRFSDGRVEQTEVQFKIELSVADSGRWTTLLATGVNGRTFFPVRYTFTASHAYFGGVPVTIERGQQYDVRVTKTKADAKNTADAAARYGDEIALYAVREIIGVGFTYPGRILLAVRALASKELSGSLDVSVEFDGAIVETDMTGGSALAYSNSPAHVLFDILTMPVITGDGDGTPYAIDSYRGPCDPADPILSTFLALETYAAIEVDDGAGGVEARLVFNGFWDNETTVGDAVTVVCAVSRCHLIWRGRRPYIQIDAARTPVAVLSDGNSRRGSLREALIPASERASEIEVHYRDALSDYDRTPVLVRNPGLAGSHKVTLQVNGVTKLSYATRIMYFELKRNQYVTRTQRRAMQFEGFVLEPGDVVYAQRPGRSWGGRLQGVNGRRIRIDRAVRRSKADRVIVQVYNAATETWALESHAVRFIRGRLIEIADDWTIAPSVENVYLFGPDDISGDTFEVGALGRRTDLEFAVDLLTYDARLFDADDVLPALPSDVGVSRAQRGTASPTAPVTQAELEAGNPGAEWTTYLDDAFLADGSVPMQGALSLKNNVRFSIDASNVVHLQRWEAGVWVDYQTWCSASSSSSSLSSSSSSSSLSSSSTSSSSSSTSSSSTSSSSSSSSSSSQSSSSTSSSSSSTSSSSTSSSLSSSSTSSSSSSSSSSGGA